MEEARPAGKPMHVCRTCSERFETQEALSRHIATTHRSPYMCRLCGFGLPDLRTLADHMKRSHGS